MIRRSRKNGQCVRTTSICARLHSTSKVSSASWLARASKLPFGSARNDAPQNSSPPSTPVRLAAADENAVGDGVAAHHRLPGRVLAGAELGLFALMPADGRRIKDDLSARPRRSAGPPSGYHWSQQTQVPMRPKRVSKLRKSKIARREIKLFVVERVVGNVHLAIDARRAAVGVENHRRVVIQPRRRAARTASRRSPRHARPPPGTVLAGGAGNRLGLVESAVVLALAGILPGKQFLQTDDIRAGRGRLGDARQAPCRRSWPSTSGRSSEPVRPQPSTA